jgi:hypothetical protein
MVAHNWEKQHQEETALRNIKFRITKKDPLTGRNQIGIPVPSTEG